MIGQRNSTFTAGVMPNSDRVIKSEGAERTLHHSLSGQGNWSGRYTANNLNHDEGEDRGELQINIVVSLIQCSR